MNSRDFGREKLRRFGSYMEIISETTVIDKEIEGIIEEGNNNSVIYIYKRFKWLYCFRFCESNFYENRSIAFVIIGNLFESCLLNFLFSFSFACKFYFQSDIELGTFACFAERFYTTFRA